MSVEYFHSEPVQQINQAIDRFHMELISALEQTHCALVVCDSDSGYPRSSVLTTLFHCYMAIVPRETAHS